MWRSWKEETTNGRSTYKHTQMAVMVCLMLSVSVYDFATVLCTCKTDRWLLGQVILREWFYFHLCLRFKPNFFFTTPNVRTIFNKLKWRHGRIEFADGQMPKHSIFSILCQFLVSWFKDVATGNWLNLLNKKIPIFPHPLALFCWDCFLLHWTYIFVLWLDAEGYWCSLGETWEVLKFSPAVNSGG